MNIYQKMPIEYSSWLHFDEESSFQDKQLVKEQQSYISVSLAYLTYPRGSQELQLITELVFLAWSYDRFIITEVKSNLRKEKPLERNPGSNYLSPVLVINTM